MKEQNLLRIIGLVDDDLVEAAEAWWPAHRIRWQPLLAACACMLIVVGLAAGVVPQLDRSTGAFAPADAEATADEEITVESAECEEAAPEAPTESSAAASTEDSAATELPVEEGLLPEEAAPTERAPKETVQPADVNGLCLLGVELEADEQLVRDLLGKPVSQTEPVKDGSSSSYTARYAPMGDDATAELTFTDEGEGYRVSRLLLDQLSGQLTLENGITIGMEVQALHELLAVIGGDVTILELDDGLLITADANPVQIRITITDDLISRVEITRT